MEGRNHEKESQQRNSAKPILIPCLQEEEAASLMCKDLCTEFTFSLRKNPCYHMKNPMPSLRLDEEEASLLSLLCRHCSVLMWEKKGESWPCGGQEIIIPDSFKTYGGLYTL